MTGGPEALYRQPEFLFLHQQVVTINPVVFRERKFQILLQL